MAKEEKEEDISPFYLKDYKKGKKGLGAIVHELDTSELLDLIEKIHADTPENVKRREEIKRDVEEGASRMADVEKKYFLQKKGKHAKHKDKPKSYSLSKDTAHKDAVELIREHAYDAIERQFGEDVVKVYKDKPHMVNQYLASHGIDFYKVRQHIADNPRNLRGQTEGAYAEMKQRLALVDNEEGTLETMVENELTTQTKHHEDTKKWAQKKAIAKGAKISVNADIGQYLDVAKRVLANKIDAEYITSAGYVKPHKEGK